MQYLSIKPLSVNQAYRGRRFATKELKQYKEDMSRILPKITIPDCERLGVIYRFGVSSKMADGDNLIKACQDILAEVYGFNDKKIYKWDIEKVDVPKGKEFVEFDFFVFS